MTQELLSGPARGTQTSFKGHDINAMPQSARGSVEAMITRLMTRKLLSCPGSEKELRREAVTKYLLKTLRSDACIDEILSLCITQGGPEGLDTAIDILSGTGELVITYTWNYLVLDIANWTPSSDRAYKPNDDYWYVLLRAIGRTDAPEDDRLRFITWCSDAGARGIREAVVEGLRDLRTQKAKDLLRHFAQNDADHYIRQVAQEALDDLES